MVGGEQVLVGMATKKGKGGGIIWKKDWITTGQKQQIKLFLCTSLAHKEFHCRIGLLKPDKVEMDMDFVG